MDKANIFDPMQLDLRQDVLAALGMHYGDRQMPEISGGAIIRRHAFFVVVVAGALTVLSAFDAPSNVDKKFHSNFNNATLPAEKIFIATGLKIQSALGAADALIGALDFGTPVSAAVLNSLVTLEISGKKVIDSQRFANLFINDDSIPDYFRFPEVRVWEPNTEMRLTQQLPAAIGAATHILYAIEGYMIERS